MYDYTPKVDKLLTTKEKTVLRLLMSSYDTVYSINNIAGECGLSPNGAFKILKKFEKEGILTAKNIANIKSYRINFDNEKTHLILELALASEIIGKIGCRLEDLKALKEITECSVLFGSYLLKKEAHDLDVLFILNKGKYKEYAKRLTEIKEIIPAKIHDVIQTKEDLIENIKKKDKVILEIIRKGIVLWGQRIIVKVIQDVYQG